MWNHIVLWVEPEEGHTFALHWLAEWQNKVFSDRVLFTDEAAYSYALAIVQEQMALCLEMLNKDGPLSPEQLQ